MQDFLLSWVCPLHLCSSGLCYMTFLGCLHQLCNLDNCVSLRLLYWSNLGSWGVAVEAGSKIHSWSDSSVPLPLAFQATEQALMELLQALLRRHWDGWMCCNSPNFGVGALAQHVVSWVCFKVIYGFSKRTPFVVQMWYMQQQSFCRAPADTSVVLDSNTSLT